MILLLTISVYKFSTKLSYFKKQPKLPVVKVSVYVLVILAFLKFSSLIVYNLPYLILKSTIEYSVESVKLGDYKTNKTGNFSDVSRPESNEDEVYVVILGESTSRAHFGLYNYPRATTPNLNSP